MVDMKRDEVAAAVKRISLILSGRFAVAELYLFGSAARNQADERSDLDFLVVFQGPATVNLVLDLADYLEELFGTRVDLITRAALKPALSAQIGAEMVRVA